MQFLGDSIQLVLRAGSNASLKLPFPDKCAGNVPTAQCLDQIYLEYYLSGASCAPIREGLRKTNVKLEIIVHCVITCACSAIV